MNIEIIKQFEGFRSYAYKDPVGIWTIGYGFTRVAGRAIRAGDVITRSEADNELLKLCLLLRSQIKTLVKAELNENQLSALISFAFNVGIGAFKNSTLLKVINADKNNCSEIKKQFNRWVYAAGRVLPGLVTRRKTEAALYCSE